MALDNLRDFLRALDARGELVRVGRPVSVDKEITEIADRCMKSPGGGPALLFEHPTLLSGGAARYPVAVNLLGSEKRMALTLDAERQRHALLGAAQIHGHGIARSAAREERRGVGKPRRSAARGLRGGTRVGE